MHKSDFDYILPSELIAQTPAQPRGTSRLLQLDHSALTDRHFRDLALLLRAGDLLVFNDTRVIPARLFGTKASGGRIEMLIERLLDSKRVLTQLHASKSPRPGTQLLLENSVSARVVGRQGEFFEVEFDGEASALDILERIGHMPLPPYIKRADIVADRAQYQTVFARAPGAVAAPTAGLHFDEGMLTLLRDAGVEFGYVTLHVGAGTFQPMRIDTVEQHRLHAERLSVGPVVCKQIDAAKREGRRVIAVGTTVVRTLESAARDGELKPVDGETDIFIYPGYRFRVVDALLTNFHLPQSTLLMLVCAFGGTSDVLAAYRHAVAGKYRFYSYGDAMFLMRAEPPG